MLDSMREYINRWANTFALAGKFSAQTTTSKLKRNRPTILLACLVPSQSPLQKATLTSATDSVSVSWSYWKQVVWISSHSICLMYRGVLHSSPSHCSERMQVRKPFCERLLRSTSTDFIPAGKMSLSKLSLLSGERNRNFPMWVTACMCPSHHPEVPISARTIEPISGEPALTRCLGDLHKARRDDVAQP